MRLQDSPQAGAGLAFQEHFWKAKQAGHAAGGGGFHTFRDARQLEALPLLSAAPPPRPLSL